MSLSANTLSALNSAPGALCSAKASVVLSGGPSGCGSREITMKRVMLSSKSWMPALRMSRPKISAARADAIAAVSRSPPSRINRALPAVLYVATTSTPGNVRNTARTARAPADARRPAGFWPGTSPGARAGCERPSAPFRRRSAARVRAAGRSCDECSRQRSFRWAGYRASPWPPPRRRTRPRTARGRRSRFRATRAAPRIRCRRLSRPGMRYASK